MELSHEDQLRLNVLLANEFDAVRIDENSMTLYALSGENEARVRLNPTGKPEPYLRRVRELLSGHVLGSPGGYPVYLRRWTRMGQQRADNLEQLLKLGEPEAVVAVAGAPGLTDELARRAWWAAPTSDNARCMLAHPDVVRGRMGAILAQHLVEHLAFETESGTMIDTVRLVLQPGLIDEATRLRIWNKGKHKRAYLVGFLQAMPDALPEPLPPRADLPEHPALAPLAQAGNTLAALLARVLDGPGQTFLSVAQTVLEKPANQDDVVALLNAVSDYFGAARPGPADRCQDLERIIQECEARCDHPGEDAALAALLRAVPGLRPEIRAMLILARSDESVVTPIFARTTAIGTVMRRKLEPVTTPLRACLAVLRGRPQR